MPQLLPACLGPVSFYESRYNPSSLSRIVNNSPECVYCNTDYKEVFSKNKFFNVAELPVSPAH